jgi:hypothetical protein
MSNIVVSQPQDDFNHRFFKDGSGLANPRSKEVAYKSNEELDAEYKVNFDSKMNNFFGIEGGIAELTKMSIPSINLAQEEVKHKQLKVENLEVTKDKYNEDRYAMETLTFDKEYVKRKQEEEKEKIRNGESISRSTDYVVEDKPAYADGSPWNKDEPESRGRGYFGQKEKGVNKETVYFSDRNSSNRDTKRGGYNTTDDKGTPRRERKVDSVYDHMGRIAQSTQDTAMKTKPWKHYAKEESNKSGWNSRNEKRSLLGRVKAFMRKPKFRITAKVGMLMSLQLGMAMVGKKYEFEGMGQAAMFLAMMMGVFYLTKELQNEDFDIRGLGIL